MRIMQVLFSNIEHIQSHTFEYEGEQEKEREREKGGTFDGGSRVAVIRASPSNELDDAGVKAEIER